MAARIHGTVLSILLARANSIAPADQGDVKIIEGFGAAGVSGCRVEATGFNSSGESVGEEKERRYSAMKKSSFKAQKVKSTVCDDC